MRLAACVELRANNITWGPTDGPVGSDYLEQYYWLSPINTNHPPSLKNPQKVKVPSARDGWEQGASKEARAKAMQDLVEIHKRIRRQFGKPEVTQGALFPLYPSIADVT
jgi:hypothetical protein